MRSQAHFTPAQEPEAWVSATEILQKTSLFLDCYDSSKRELQEKQDHVNGLVAWRFRVFQRSRIWSMEREISVINRLARMSVDDRILISASDLDLVFRATPLAVEDALRDLDKKIAFQLDRKAEDVTAQCKSEVIHESRKRIKIVLGTFAVLVAGLVAVAARVWL